MALDETSTQQLTVDDVQTWIAGKVAQRLGTTPESIELDKFWDEFGLESNEALMLTGELEGWLGIEIETTALWHHPTIGDLAAYVVEELHQADGDLG